VRGIKKMAKTKDLTKQLFGAAAGIALMGAAFQMWKK